MSLQFTKNKKRIEYLFTTANTVSSKSKQQGMTKAFPLHSSLSHPIIQSNYSIKAQIKSRGDSDTTGKCTLHPQILFPTREEGPCRCLIRASSNSRDQSHPPLPTKPNTELALHCSSLGPVYIYMHGGWRDSPATSAGSYSTRPGMLLTSLDCQSPRLGFLLIANREVKAAPCVLQNLRATEPHPADPAT